MENDTEANKQSPEIVKKPNNRPKFALGNSGRPKGAKNKVLLTVKQTVLQVFNDLQNGKDTNLKAFARKYPKEFYLMAAKLIPTEVTGETNTVIRVLFGANKPTLIEDSNTIDITPLEMPKQNIILSNSDDSE